MNIYRAKEILSVLADGVNPMTGEILPPEDSCNQADVIRALHTIIEAIPSPNPKSQPQNAGKPWIETEENKLLDEFDLGMSISAIAKEHGRTRGAIESRLIALGKLDRTFRGKEDNHGKHIL